MQGNIVAQADCDGIVNAPNEWPIAGGGACSAIYAAADP
jgi:O-acetyl-ADP-ribose deacetylase (regulator of RNase III)